VKKDFSGAGKYIAKEAKKGGRYASKEFKKVGPKILNSMNPIHNLQKMFSSPMIRNIIYISVVLIVIFLVLFARAQLK
jgi:flagellar biosynthesis protein FlhB